MRHFQTSPVPQFLIFLAAFAALLLAPQRMRADEISFGETYVEKLTADDDLIWSGSTELNITLPWNGFNIDTINGDTEINFSIGDFQFDRVLDAADDYEEGDLAARFTDSDVDNNGNPVTIVFVDITWNTKTFTISTTLRNFSNAGEANFIGALDHLDVAGSFTETNAADIAFGGFSTNYPIVFSGKTKLTHKVVNEEDINLNDVALSGDVDLPPNDTKPPTVSITTPSANGRLLTNVITGKASDNVGVAEVFYRIGDGEFTLADGTNNWSATVSLLPGTNVVEVKSIDLAGNESSVLSRTFFYVLTSPLTVEINDAWGSTTLTNGQLLELAKTYSITAMPKSGYKFQDWTGDINSTNATISFVMSTNFLLQPNFVLAPDTTSPTVSITAPSANGRFHTNVITVEGKASDNGAVAAVFYRVGDGEFTLADGTTTWSASVSLLPGTNVVEVKSRDLVGLESPPLSRSFYYVVTSPLTVTTNNPDWGSTTLTNGQLLELTKTYSITANPKPGYKFRDWTGDTNSQNAIISFVMSSNFLLQANFVTNPFIPIKGIYNGLFSNTNGVTPESSGYFTADVKDSGAFSGKILFGGTKYSVSGQFGLSGVADKTIVTGKDSVILHLEIGFGGSLSGTLRTNAVSTNEVNSTLEAELAQTTTTSATTKYTLLIPPASDPALAPGGYGFGSVSVDHKGKLRFSGTLSDGTPISQTTMVSTNGRWPLFVSLYHSHGVLLGWMVFTNQPDSDVRGDLTWSKLAGARNKFYTNGFTIAGTAIGSLYEQPPQGTTVLNSTNPTIGSLEFSAGNLSAPLTNTFFLGTNNKFTVASTNKTTLSATRSSGFLKGNFVHPDTRKTTSFKGAILQKPMWGGGFFLGTNQSGALLLQPDSVAP